MSLIQDALKRKSEEKSAAFTPVTVNTEEMPAGSSVEAEIKSPRPLLIVLIILLTAAVLTALSGLAFYLIRTPAPDSPAETAPVAETSPEIPLPKEIPAAPAVPLPAAESTKELPPGPPVAVTPAGTIPAPEIMKPWPELKLTGIASSGSQRIAIINGKMLTTGRTIGDIVVREIHETRAVVEFHGERRILHVDE